jgi:hypothetical protein
MKKEVKKMRKQQKSVLVLVIASAFIAAIFWPGLTSAGNLDPTAAPGPTMKTLDQIPPTWSQILPADDGDSSGCNSSRFECVMGGQAVLDKETGLVWEQSPDTTTKTWYAACSHCFNRSVFYRKGWRLPTIEELTSLFDMSLGGFKLPSGHPFANVQNATYWSSTSSSEYANYKWYVFMSGSASTINKGTSKYVWCVRGGH